jgi:hypothetical protein
MTGRIADGTTLRPRSPTRTSSAGSTGQVREAAVAAGREASAVRVQAAAPAHVGQARSAGLTDALLPALVSNHVADLGNKSPREQLPASLTGPPDRGDRLPAPGRRRLEQRGVVVGDEVTAGSASSESVGGHGAKLHKPRPGGPFSQDDERRRGGPAGGLRPRRASSRRGMAGRQGPDPKVRRVRPAIGRHLRRTKAPRPRPALPAGSGWHERCAAVARRDPSWWEEGNGVRRDAHHRIDGSIAFVLAIRGARDHDRPAAHPVPGEELHDLG